MIRALLTVASVLVGNVAYAQSAVQAPLQWTPPGSQRGYWGAGYVRMPTTLDAFALEGDGYSVAGGGMGLALHVGVTTKWYVDASLGAHFGSGNVERDTGSGRANYLGWYLSTSAGRKVYIDNRVFVVVFAGISRSSAFLDSSGSNGDDPNRFFVATQATALPVGVFATFGRKIHVVPSFSAAYSWNGRMQSRTGPEPQVRTGETLDPFTTWSAAVEVGYVPGGQYLALSWQHTPALAAAGPYDVYLLRFTWAIKLSKAAGVRT